MDIREDKIMNPLALVLLIGSWFIEPSEPTTLVFPPFGHCMNIYKAGNDELALMLGGMVSFDDPQGLACVKLSAWDEPGLSDDDELTVYGVNSRSGHVIYNASMYALGLYGGTGSGPDELMGPHGVAADSEGLVLVADTGNGRVVILDRNERRLVQIGFLAGDMAEPWDVALDGSGSIYVTDRSGGRMLVYNSLADSLPSAIVLELPRGIAATGSDRWTTDHGVFQAVITENGSRLVTVVDGEISGSAVPGDCGGRTFNYVDIDYYGNIWATDSISCQIHKFNSDLEYLDSFGEPGKEDGQLDAPTGISIWNRFGQVFVAESEGARYFWVGTDFRELSFRSDGVGFTFSASVTEPANVRATVLDPGGEEVKTVYNARVTGRIIEFDWDGTDSRGQGLPAGEYTLTIVIEPTYSSRGYFHKTFRRSFSFDGVSTELPPGTRG